MSDHQTRQREEREAKRLKREQRELAETQKTERAVYQVDAELTQDVMLQLLIDNLHLPEDTESISVVERRNGNFVFIARRRGIALESASVGEKVRIHQPARYTRRTP